MLVAKNDKWDKSHTAISKYLIERLIQLTDYNESISCRHKTTNGYVLICEIIDVCKQTLSRQKSVN